MKKQRKKPWKKSSLISDYRKKEFLPLQKLHIQFNNPNQNSKFFRKFRKKYIKDKVMKIAYFQSPPDKTQIVYPKKAEKINSGSPEIKKGIKPTKER